MIISFCHMDFLDSPSLDIFTRFLQLDIHHAAEIWYHSGSHLSSPQDSFSVITGNNSVGFRINLNKKLVLLLPSFPLLVFLPLCDLANLLPILTSSLLQGHHQILPRQLSKINEHEMGC